MLSMMANKTEREFAKVLDLPEEELLEAFEEHMAKKAKQNEVPAPAAPEASTAVVTQ